jgi:hypothetical protein
MENMRQFLLAVNTVDRRRVLSFFIMSMASVFFQYSALVGIFGFIKLKVDAANFLNLLNEFSFELFSFELFTDIPSVDLKNVSIFFILIFVFFYCLSGVASLVGKSISAKVVHDYRRRLYYNARNSGLLKDVPYKKALGTYLTLHRRYLQMIPPLFVVLLGTLVFYVIDKGLFYLLVAGVFFVILVALSFCSVLSKKDKRAEEDQDQHHRNYVTEYFSYLSKLFSQAVSVSIFGIMLFFALEEEFSVEDLLVTVIIGRIVLGNLVNFISPLMEISGKVSCFSVVKNEVV